MVDTGNCNVRMHTLNGKRLRLSLLLGSLVLGLMLLGCSGTASKSDEVFVEHVVEREVPVMESEALVAASGAPLEPGGVPDAKRIAERVIIRNGSISMTVEDTLAAQEAIEEMVTAMAGDGAFVVSSEERGRGDEGLPYISMSIRVPSARFDETMDRLADLAVKVNDRNEQADDVTEEYVDLEARLESMEAARQRLLEIMAEARTTEDLLQAEEQLTQREAQIESIKGRMQYLAQSAELASIWINLQPYILSQPLGDQWRPAETVRRAFEALVGGLRALGNFLIFFAIAVLPWLVLLGLVIYAILWLTRRRRRRRREKRAARDQDETA